MCTGEGIERQEMPGLPPSCYYHLVIAGLENCCGKWGKGMGRGVGEGGWGGGGREEGGVWGGELRDPTQNGEL